MAVRSCLITGALRGRLHPFVPDRLRNRLLTRVLGLPARDRFEGTRH
jgi:hypothetical protein